MFSSPKTQWEKILTKSLKKQSTFLNKICTVNRKDHLVIRTAFFDHLGFAMVKKIFDLVRDVVKSGAIDFSFQEIIFDRLLMVSEISHLYPDDIEVDENIIFGEGYHVYSACYDDLNLIIEFMKLHKNINSICDLGSGSGRALLYIALETNNALEYVGLELVEERVEFTNSIVRNFGLQSMFFKTSNFLKTPEDFLGFDAYYLYDPVGTDDVPLLISHFTKMISDGHKFYILFISGWDDLMLNALNDLKELEMINSISSRKQVNRYVNFYKVKDFTSAE